MSTERWCDRRVVPADAGPLAAPLEQLCSGCDGTGIFLSHAWEEWDQRRTRLRLRRRAADGTAVMADLLDESLAAHIRDKPTEPREVPCEDCAGVGTVPTAEGAELLAFLRRHLNEEKEAP